MRKNPSLTRRLTIALVVLQWIAAMVAYVALNLVNGNGMLAKSASSDLGADFVQRSVTKGSDGRFTVQPGGDLAKFLESHPDAWYVVTDGERSLTGGGTEALTSLNYDELSTAVATVMRLTKADVPTATTAKVDGKEVLVLAGGSAVTWDDTAIVLSAVLKQIALPVTVPLVAGAILVLAFIARRLLRSINVAAQAAKRISPNARGERLPTERIPRELLPLVDAINTALASLDAGYERYRRFVADAAHELRTPIAVLGTRLDGLEDGALKDQLNRDVRRISNIATKLLEMERVQQSALRDEPVDVVALVRAVAGEIAPLAVEKGYDLEVTTATPETVVVADGAALRNAVANLVSNAVAHGGNRGLIRIDVSAQGMIDVSDEGPGIPGAETQAVFEPFHRLNPGGGGAGLGLAIVREIMRAHGGEAVLLNPGGPGASFRLRLPAERRPVAPLRPDQRYAGLAEHAPRPLG